jgi:septal ring factor EnvC (AmiA/AmiB activator)
MNDTVLTAVVAALFGLLGSGLMVAVAWKKAPVENANMSADTASKYQKIASDAADKVIQLQAQLDKQCELQEQDKAEMQAQIDKLQIRIEELEDALASSCRKISEQQRGIVRLIKQLESKEITPVWTPEESDNLRGEIEKEVSKRKGGNHG